VIQFRNLRLARGAKILVDAASLQIHPGWRVGLTGANGTGKSSLFALLRGQLHQDQGDLEIPAGWQIAHVAQETPALAKPAIEYVLDGDAELRDVESKLAAAEAAHDGAHIGELHARLHEIGGYAARSRAAALLYGLGFVAGDPERPVADFSGGWRMRLNLAQALMCRSDLLLLDEPTNHLDLDAVLWLEHGCATTGATLVLICTTASSSTLLHTRRTSIRSGRRSTPAVNPTSNGSAPSASRQQSLFRQAATRRSRNRGLHPPLPRENDEGAPRAEPIKALERMERIAAAHIYTPFAYSAFRDGPAAPIRLLQIEGGAIA